MVKLLSVLVLVLLASGCASAVDRHQVLQAELERPIDCDTAALDITALVKEKPTRREKIANGIASILPTSALINLIAGEYRSRVSIASGKFENKLYNRIMDIEAACGRGALAGIIPDAARTVSR